MRRLAGSRKVLRAEPAFRGRPTPRSPGRGLVRRPRSSPRCPSTRLTHVFACLTGIGAAFAARSLTGWIIPSLALTLPRAKVGGDLGVSFAALIALVSVPVMVGPAERRRVCALV